MKTASENSHHWRSLKSPACGKDHRWRLSNVTRQWWPTAVGCLMWPASGDFIYIYTRRALETFLSLARNEMTWSGCQIFPPSAVVVPDCRRPSDHFAVLQECLADLHERLVIVREGPAPSPCGPPPSSTRAPPLLPWTAAAPSSAGAPPTDDLLPERHRPSSLPGRPPPSGPLPQPPARNRYRLLRRCRQHRRRLRRQLRRPRSPPTPHLLTARHAWRPWMGPAA
jgi:hypothetical protein